MKRLVAVGILLLFCTGSRAEPRSPFQLAEVGIDQKLDQQVPLDLRLRDEAGHELPLASFFGHQPVLLVPAYYGCPMLCSQILGGLAGSLKGMSLNAGTDFQVVVVSFDPRDTPTLAAEHKAIAVRRYHRRSGAAGWHFLTGTEPTITRLMQAIGYRYAYDPPTGQYSHAAGLAVLTPEGRISGYLLGLDFAPRDLRLSIVQAAAGKVGSPVDRLLLFCYRYDPTRGKYGAPIIAAVQAGGLLTILGLLVLIGALWRQDRRLQ